jgi:hypothetical protein
MNTAHVNQDDLLADTEESDERIVMATLATGDSVPLAVAERVRERARRIRERVAKEHGVLDTAVSAIRELRD